ncbi:MAG: glutathione S-transferase family protein [Hydrogenophaga sp.]|uniref:glutathione S-transferase family protein n=1 Tax=Hydrogenophaga sp. TaxID=1904254 RepID=UPI00271C8671|nr:glutathione S-transferase family protein [Hydrogenophaga sp.]MDO9159860.1 glutathione S-transferase family protein [Burkholderiaceae bacterium]MDZ4177277.1 glutathione S-transferase family protein [Hydrogenophaga sp.]
MKLYVTPRAPNPRRVTMFMAEKAITGIELVAVDINAHEHRSEAFRHLNPLTTVPTLVLDDGRALSESRAICTWLEGQHPEPNLMGADANERAFIEMADRRAEWYLMVPIGQVIRHTHPGLAALEQPQFADYGQAQMAKVRDYASRFDQLLQTQPWMAGERFTIADITAFCALEFARLMKFSPKAEGLDALQAWRDRVAERPSAKAL